VRNKSLKKSARYRDEKPPRPDLPKREELEEVSRRFGVKYLLGVMNSSAARNFLRSNRRSNTDLYPDDWKKLPIPAVPSEGQKPVERLVEQILSAKQRDAGADVTALERELDELVYALYALTPEEIKIVEGATK
jgi:type II secretory pathway predicted ATPase ExeA